MLNSSRRWVHLSSGHDRFAPRLEPISHCLVWSRLTSISKEYYSAEPDVWITPTETSGNQSISGVSAPSVLKRLVTRLVS